jgi:hypothetical protein
MSNPTQPTGAPEQSAVEREGIRKQLDAEQARQAERSMREEAAKRQGALDDARSFLKRFPGR